MVNGTPVAHWKCPRCEYIWVMDAAEQAACPCCACVTCGEPAKMRDNRQAMAPEFRYYPHCEKHMPRKIGLPE